MRKFARTVSGVTPVAVMTEPLACPGECLYCPTYPDAPQSYTPESPAVLRARQCNYDARLQVELRLRILSEMGHPTDKIELIVMGGTFLAHPAGYQYRFIKGCYDGLNGAESATLEEAKRRNETAAHRSTGLCIETRPDWCGPGEIERMLEFGATRVELGVQTLDDEIYRLVKRGHTVADVVRASQLLRDSAFKVHYHWMPGLPGATPETDRALSAKLFADKRFRPDGLKLYPTMVIEGTELEKWYREGLYRPYDLETMVDLLTEIKALVPGYVRISRVLRDIPPRFIRAGCRDSLREMVKERMGRRKLECRCVRCREYGHRRRNGWETGEPHLVRMDYRAAGGEEVFLSCEDEKETLFGLLRIRLPGNPVAFSGRAQNGVTALIRELHVFGPEVSLRERQSGAAQHRGLGRTLLREAERIAGDEFGAKRVAVLSGVGAREYYRSDGYELQGGYMVKEL